MTWNSQTIESLWRASMHTQRVFADRVGCTESTLNGWINTPRDPSPIFCARLDAIAAELAQLAEPSTPDPGAISPLPASPQALSPAPGSDVGRSTTDRGDAI